jgi:hypothetical protein
MRLTATKASANLLVGAGPKPIIFVINFALLLSTPMSPLMEWRALEGITMH